MLACLHAAVDALETTPATAQVRQRAAHRTLHAIGRPLSVHVPVKEQLRNSVVNAGHTLAKLCRA